MKYNFSYIQIFISMLTLALNGCASLPSHVIVAPDITISPTIDHKSKQAQLDVIDMRTANHIIQILRKDDAATLLSSQERLEDTIKYNLDKYWKNQGLDIKASGDNTISVAIEKAIISVDQETFKYKVQTEIILIVTVNNGDETLTSTFKNKGNSNGPLQADIAVLERNFNQRLANLLQQILANEKISHFLK